MRKLLLLALALSLIAAPGCGNKKKEAEKEKEEQEKKFELKSCPLSRIEIDPERVNEASCYLGSGCEIELNAAAYDQDGNRVSVPLTWGFRYSDFGTYKEAGGGHELEKVSSDKAIFKADGVAHGLFTVSASDESCNMGTEEEPQYVEGQSWVTVHNDPDAEISCDRMRVTYGARLDRMGDRLIASSKVLLIAEVSAKEQLGRRYRVIFYVNGEPYPSKRPLYRDNETDVAPGMEVAHIALLPMYLTPGDYEVRYDLIRKEKVICGSKMSYFSAK